MFRLEDCIAYITSRGAKVLAERLEERFEGSGISRVQWIAMYYVNGCPSITQKQLADKMNLKEPTVVRLLDRMEGLFQDGQAGPLPGDDGAGNGTLPGASWACGAV